MRQIIKSILSAVNMCCECNTSFFYFKPKKSFLSFRLLMLISFCAAGLMVNAQEVVQASFSNFDFEGCVPVKVQFTDNSTGSPTSWFWDFGDGHTSTQQNPSNIYSV